jgi:aspartokinase-like uncharacterized kinase
MRNDPLSARASAGIVRAGPPVVVKLGGSVVRSSELGAWLDVLAKAPVPIVVVPGGGALADEVRATQRALGIGDAPAHRMALLAMDQLAWAIAALRLGFEVGAMEDALQYILRKGRVAVWAPYALVADRAEIPQSWMVTSDSLALWLAWRLGAGRLYVIKSIERQRAARSAEQLSRDGVLDAAFPAMLKGARLHAVLLGRGEQAALAASLATGAPCGAAID